MSRKKMIEVLVRLRAAGQYLDSRGRIPLVLDYHRYPDEVLGMIEKWEHEHDRSSR